MMHIQLWNINKTEYKNDELYQRHKIEQYKMYVEMADRISSRRNSVNVFFLSIQTGILSLIGYLIQIDGTAVLKIGLLLPCGGLLLMCFVWWWLLSSYRNLNSAKFKVIGKFEERLPASPFWKAEWEELGKGKNWKKYLPLSFLEQYVPLTFGLLYFILFIITLIVNT